MLTLAQLPRPRRGRDDHDRGPVPDQGAVVRPQRLRHIRPGQQVEQVAAASTDNVCAENSGRDATGQLYIGRERTST